jgi:anaerobic magnesium-protoporphyrin IX monomethyl ester cyclase
MVKVMHMVADKVGGGEFVGTLMEFNPDIVGFTVATYQTKFTRALLNIVKIHDDRIITIVGGPHPSALGGEILVDFLDADIAICGEGEDAITSIAAGVPLSDIGGICYRSDGKIVANNPRPLMADLDNLPYPDKSLVDFKRYNGLFPVGRRPCMFIMSSRGCPYQCTFCSRSVYGSTLRMRSPENIMGEVELLYRDWGVREIHFGDDTFNANRQWANELLDLIIKGGYHKKLVFRVALRVNRKLLDLDLLKHLKAAGVWFVYYGVENGNQAMLDHMRKGITVEEVERAFALTHSVGIKTEAFFIIGMPGETVQTIQDSRNLYNRIKPYWGGYSRAMPLPGTTFTQEVKASGHLLSEDYDEYGPSSMVVKTEALTSGELNEWVIAMDKMTRWDKIKRPKQVAYAIRDKIRR